MAIKKNYVKRALFQNQIVVKKSSTHGYGVFAKRNIKKGERIEECYALIAKTAHSAFEDYYFNASSKYALLTGFGSIYNHSDDPNAECYMEASKRLATFKALRVIQKGEEIFVSYGRQWFSSRGWSSKKVNSKKIK